MNILDGLPPAPLWDWVFNNLGDLGFRFNPDYSAWRGNHRGLVFYVFATEPFVARLPDRTMDLCAILGEWDGVSADDIRRRIQWAYTRSHPEEARAQQPAGFTQSGNRYRDGFAEALAEASRPRQSGS